MLTQRKLLYGTGYVLYILSIVLLTDYLSCVYFLHKTMPASVVVSREKMTELESRVGWIENDKRSSFANFNPLKPDGVIRIGCFGDSFTHGAEVNDQLDYPSLLQNIFNKHGYNNVQVINFGTGGYGFHQTHMMWEWAKETYDLDFVLLMPPFLLEGRDSTFNNRFNYSKDIYNFHSRYILKNKNDIERIDVIGTSTAERMKHYWRFIPALRYLRFDSYPPLFLSAPVSCLFPDRRLKGNPFYYKKNVPKEMDTIYKILLARMSQGSSQVILGTYDPHVEDLAKAAAGSNLFTTLFDYSKNFPYKAFMDHNSPLGNEAVALQMFDCLTNKPESDLPLIETTNMDRQFMPAVQADKLPLSSFTNISLEINHVPIGRFYDASITDQQRYCHTPACVPEVNTFSGTTSLLLIQSNGLSILDYSIFVPLDFEITDGLPVVLRVGTMTGKKDYVLGRVRLLNPGVNIGTVDFLSYGYHTTVWLQTLPVLSADSLPPESTVTILLKDTAILHGKLQKSRKENPLDLVSPRYFIIRADGRQWLDTSSLANEGIVYLSLDRGKKSRVSIPFAKWKKVNKRIPLGRSRLHSIPAASFRRSQTQ